MHSFITTLLLAGTAILAAPLEAPKPKSCAARSQKLTHWDVQHFDYHASYIFTTPAHQNAHGYVNFTLVNPALDAPALCTASSTQLSDFFYGNQVFQCEMPANLSAQASFAYDRASGALQINQTWMCPGEQARFWAMGGVMLDLDCTDSTWQNPNWQAGQFYSVRTVTCDPEDVKAPIRQMNGIR
jgi:Alternaria alternata allergen 1